MSWERSRQWYGAFLDNQSGYYGMLLILGRNAVIKPLCSYFDGFKRTKLTWEHQFYYGNFDCYNLYSVINHWKGAWLVPWSTMAEVFFSAQNCLLHQTKWKRCLKEIGKRWVHNELWCCNSHQGSLNLPGCWGDKLLQVPQRKLQMLEEWQFWLPCMNNGNIEGTQLICSLKYLLVEHPLYL